MSLDDTRIEQDEEAAFREIDAQSYSTAWKSAPVISAGPGATLPIGLEAVNRPFFEHQKRALRELDRWWEGSSPAGVLCLPTGGGKTRTATGFVLRRLGERVRTLWLAHRVELVTQAVATLAESSAEAVQRFNIGRFDAQAKAQVPVDVVVASIPTLSRRSGRGLGALDTLLGIQKRFDLVVVDECHHGVAGSWARLIETLKEHEARVLGLSATPTRTSAKEVGRLWRLFGEVIYEEPLLELIRHRVLSRPRPIAMATERSFRASDKERREFESFGDLPATLVKRISDDYVRNERIVAAIRNNQHTWGQILVFSGSIEQARSLALKLREVGVPAASVDGSTRPETRHEVVERFRRNELRVVTNVNLFTEGTDLPSVETVIIARPTRSRILFQQMVGRGMRGPRVGGSAFCNIVMFHDEVEGLLEQSLASTFTSEREALDALDIESLETPSVPVEPPSLVEPPTPSHDTQALLRYLEDAARGGSEVLEGAALLGWWEARTPSEVAYLPVFQGIDEAARSWVDELQQRHRSSIPRALREGLPITVLEAFRDAAEHPQSTIRHVELEDATDQLDALVRRLRAVEDDVEVPEWWQAESIGADAVVFEDEEGVLVFAAEALEALQDDLPGLRRRVARGAALADVTDRLYKDVYADYGLALRQFQRLVHAALRDDCVPTVRPASAPDESGVLAALRVVPADKQSEVVARALEMGLSSHYESVNALVSRLLSDLVQRKTEPLNRLTESQRFTERVPAAERERVASVVDQVLSHGGIVDVRSLAHAASIPVYRVAGFVATLGEYLNVDGYRVVSFDAGARQVRIDGDKLFQLFEVSA